MIKRTIAIERPARLSMRHRQLVIESREAQASVPIEDIGALIISDPQVSFTHSCMSELMENKTAVVFCARDRHPAGMVLPLDGNTLQSERFREQAGASMPLKKRLWQQTVRQKIRNQADILKSFGSEHARLMELAKKVRSGDPDNIEAQAARHYWPRLMGKKFRRNRHGPPPNNMLNYCYMVLRAAVARSLVSSGLLPTLGIHHRNRYNAFCLADDIMEPYRIFADIIVYKVQKEGLPMEADIGRDIKARLLGILTEDVRFKDESGPLMVGLHRTTASLARCFKGEQRHIDYPELWFS